MCSILRHAVEYHITPTESARTTLGIGGVEGADDGTGDDVRVCRIKGDGTGCDADALKVRVVVTDVPLNSHHGHPHHIEHDVAASAVAEAGAPSCSPPNSTRVASAAAPAAAP